MTETEIVKWAVDNQYSPTLDDMSKDTDVFERKVQRAIQASQRLAHLQRGGAGGFGSGPMAGSSAHPLSGMPGLPDFSGGINSFTSSIPALDAGISIIRTLTLAIGAAAVAMGAFGVYSMKTAGDIDAYRTALAAVLGDQQKAIIQFQRLEEIARNPGLGYIETIKGFLGIYGAGADQRMSERIISQFGNLNALNGGGKEQLQFVLMAVQQMLSKGKVSAEEINQQLAEHLPQIRELMKKAFGTADIATIASTMSSQEFIAKLVNEMEKLPRAADGAKNTFENFADGLLRNIDKIGMALNRDLIPELEHVNKLLGFAADMDVFADIIPNLSKGFKRGMDAFNSDNGAHPWLRNSDSKLNNPADYAGVQKMNSDTGMDQLKNFISSSKSLGDGLVRGAMIFIAGVEMLPDIMHIFGGYVALFKDSFSNFWEKLKALIQDLLNFFNTGIEITGPGGIAIGHIGSKAPTMVSTGIPGVDLSGRQKQLEEQTNGLVGEGMARARELYNEYLASNPSNSVANDPTKGGFRDPASMTAANTQKLVDLQEKNNQQMNMMLGGGAIRDQAFSQTNLSKLSKGHGRDAKLHQAVELIKEFVYSQMPEVYSGIQSANPLRA